MKYFVCCTRLDLCAAAKLIFPVNASTNSTAFASCAGSGFYWSKHFNHKCEECLDALYSGLFLKLVITLVTNVRESQDLLTPVLACFSCRFLSLENAFASCGLTSLCIAQCAITPVTIVKNSQELFTPELAYLSCHLSPPFLRELTRKSWCFINL